MKGRAPDPLPLIASPAATFSIWSAAASLPLATPSNDDLVMRYTPRFALTTLRYASLDSKKAEWL
jgi:hypothetical protein